MSLFGVSTVAVLKWMRRRPASDKISAPKTVQAEVVHVEKTKFVSGEVFAGYRAVLLDGTSGFTLRHV